jgi:hypothetical protein
VRAIPADIDGLGNLVLSGRREEARAAVRDLVLNPAIDAETHETAIMMMGFAGFGEEAERLVDEHVKRFGEPPEAADRETIKRLVAQRRDVRERAGRGEPRVYRRRAFCAGGLGRCLPGELGWAREVVLDREGLQVRRWRTRRYLWSEVTEATLERRETYGSMGRNRLTSVRRLMRLLVPDGEVVIDLSSTHPELERPDLIEEEIRRRVPVRDGPVEPVEPGAELRRMLMLWTPGLGMLIGAAWALEWAM